MTKAKSKHLNIVAGLGLAVFSTVLLSFSNKPLTGEEIVHKMFDKWQGKWYPNVSFEQKAIFYKDNSIVKEEVWQEILSSPGNLHIRFNGFNSQNGAVYTQDSVYRFKNGTLEQKNRETNYLQLLGFDIYFYKPERSIDKLKELGFDLNKSYTTKWNNQDVLVVGANDKNDLNSSQFWIDSKKNYVVRILKNTQGQVRDVLFSNYQHIDNHWIATEMIFKNGDQIVFVEKYFNIKFPATVTPEVFNPTSFSTAKWD